MHKKKAVDVVLLPEEKITQKAIEMNAQLIQKCGSRLVLNKKDCLPHISLAMGCIDDGDLADINSTLKDITRDVQIGSMEIVGIEAQINAFGETMLLFKISRSNELQLLHEQVMESMLGFFKHKVSDDMLFDHTVELSTLIWIRDYRERSSFYHFYPHITLGYGAIETAFPRLKFKPEYLAVCHLGNHCTCREVLLSIPL
jgi:2'-5' RNA ligase